ncbi:hypothetical protein ECEC1856_5753, partial [Escherichia coli EC1856]
VDGPRGKNEYF